MCAAADLEFLADDSHILIRFQEDVWGVTELCNKGIGEFKILERSVTCCHARHTQADWKQFWVQWDKNWIKKKHHQQMSLLCMTLMEKALDVLSTPLTLAVQT